VTDWPIDQLTNQLTPWSRVLLEKLTVTQLVTSALSHMNPVHIFWSYLSKIHSNIILPPMSRSSRFLTKILCPCLIFPVRATCTTHPILLDLITLIFGEVKKLCSSSLCSLLQPLPLRSKYYPQHPVLKYPQSMFFLLCLRPSFTHSYKPTGLFIAKTCNSVTRYVQGMLVFQSKC